MASLGGDQQISSNSQTAEPIQRGESREGSIERKDRHHQIQADVAQYKSYALPSSTAQQENQRMENSTLHWFALVGGDDSTLQVTKDREEKLKWARERQNEERQRKIEELKAQAEAAQRYREQKEEERRRRIEEIRHRDSEKRHQVEERKRAIMEAEKERREYILRKNQERESRLETKKRERNSIAFAFGSSTPRLLEPAEFGMVSPSTFWGQRRSTSISNVAGASLSRRSSERELIDSGTKKRATSASGTERHDDHRRKSSSMYEVFNWGYSNDEPPKRFSLSIVGSEINIDEPSSSSSPSTIPTTTHRQYSNHITSAITTSTTNTAIHSYFHKEDNVDTTSHIVFRSVARRKTDLMPTIPSPRDGHYGSRTSLSNTPKTPGRAYSMNRLDQLAQPIRRNGEHIRAIFERERLEQMEMLDETESLGGGRRKAGGHRRQKKIGSSSSNTTSNGGSIMSRSMTHLAGGRSIYSLGGGISSSSCFKPLGGNGQRERTSKSSRSGNVTPGGSISASRPGSAMSTSTTISTTGYVARRSVPITRKTRPASIAGTGVSLDEINKLKKENKPPLKLSTPSTSAQTTPKRTSNSLMSTSMIVTSSSRLSSAEKKTTTALKRESHTPGKQQTAAKLLSKTTSSERLNKVSREKSRENVPIGMTKSAIIIPLAPPNSVNTSAEKADIAREEQLKPVVAVEPEEVNQQQTMPSAEQKQKAPTVLTNNEKVDQGNEKKNNDEIITEVSELRKAHNNGGGGGGSVDSKENSEVRELLQLYPQAEINDAMTASMIAKNKITTEEEAKAALAERRRLAREEAERQAELERQRLEAERLAEIKRQEEEAERQRLFEEESTRLAAEQRKAEEERLRQAIEEAEQREEEERRRKEEEERQRLEREEAEKKAKEEAEKQRVEVAERLKREEKEREERRKRVEAIMSRTRKAGSATTPNNTPVKESSDTEKQTATTTTPNNAQNEAQQQPADGTAANNSDSSSSTSASTTTATTPIPPIPVQTATVATNEPQNSQAMYEQSVIEKEAALLNSFSNMIIDENAKNLQQQHQPLLQHQQQQQQHHQHHHEPQSQIVEVSNSKLHTEFPNSDVILQNSTTTAATVANGNGHIENMNNKNDINILQNVVVTPSAQLIDLSFESQDINNTVNFNNNNNNSILATTTTLVTADSHENKDISLL